MSTVTHGEREVRSGSSRRRTRTRSGGASRYLVMNGATMVSIAAIAITVIGLLYLVQTAHVAQLGYDMSRLHAQRENLTMEISELEYELSRFESIQTVEGVAEAQLGMTPLTNYEFVEIQEPANRQLSLPDEERHESRSWLGRVQDALTGAGAAESETADMPEQPANEARP